jgi:hypothetical protein
LSNAVRSRIEIEHAEVRIALNRPGMVCRRFVVTRLQERHKSERRMGLKGQWIEWTQPQRVAGMGGRGDQIAAESVDQRSKIQRRDAGRIER